MLSWVRHALTEKFDSNNIYNDEIGVIHLDDLNRKYKLDLGFVVINDEEPMIW